MIECIRLIKTFLIAILVGIILEKFFFSFTIVQGLSMYPTLHNDDKLFINKFSYNWTKPHTGDIVIFEPPIKDREKELFIKRIIAMEGDSFKIDHGKIYVNSRQIKEEYIEEEDYDDKEYSITEGTVPAGMVFVLGDNRNDSNDSRCFGYVSLKSIKGKAKYRIWPVETITVFSNSSKE
ncbi:MAG: signal peptidase I [Thermotaleaceae bacterium]